MNDTNRPLVIYHANCPDGFCAAWIAHKRFGDDADYVPAQYGEDPPEAASDKDRPLYILDFSYPGDVIFRLAALRHVEMFVLDHHKTAEEALRDIEIELVANNCGDALTVHFDMGKSGGRLAWEHFYPGDPAPWLVDYTEDRDLWKWALRDSREVNASLASYPRTFATWDALATEYDHVAAWPKRIADEGRSILRYQDQLVESLCKTAATYWIGGHEVLAANTSCLFSEVAGKLAEGMPFGAAWFIRSDGKRQWSLRSRDSGVDVAEIAKKYGGGGHRNAAGFEDAIIIHSPKE